MQGYLSADIICSEKRTVFRERSSRKTVSIEEQIMSKGKYPCIFSSQMETIVFIILQIFFATRAVLKIGVYLTVILRGRAGYELIYITNEAVGRVGYYQLISGKSEKNNCFYSKFSSSPITGNCHSTHLFPLHKTYSENIT